MRCPLGVSAIGSPDALAAVGWALQDRTRTQGAHGTDRSNGNRKDGVSKRASARARVRAPALCARGSVYQANNLQFCVASECHKFD